MDFDLDYVISYIRSGKLVQEQDVFSILMKLQELLFLENNVIELQSPIIICGDIHGQLFDLCEMFEKSAPDGVDSQKFLFMGDYVDRGYFSMETFALLASYKIKYPSNIYLLRGNHECRKVNQSYGFYEQTLTNYGHSGIWQLSNDTFDLLPMAALIDGKIFSIHGGLSPTITYIEQINLLDRQDELPREGFFCDLCWSDPEDDYSGWEKSQRGAGYIFGEDQVNEFCHNNGISLITRSHQLVFGGYEYLFNKKLVTIWSAPNYMQRSRNKATVLRYDPSKANEYELIFFESGPNEKKRYPQVEESMSEYFV